MGADKLTNTEIGEITMAGYQIKVNMEYVKPPMWRRLAIPDRITFADLHDLLQIVFGWENGHLHIFKFQNFEGAVGDTETFDVEYEERDLLADDFLKDGWIRYVYDFGDDWCHKIVLEKELPDYDFRYPQVLKFRRNNFAEDSGGVWSDEEQGEYDMAEVNAMLEENCLCTVSGECQTMGDLETERVEYEEFLAQMDGYSAMIEEIREWLHIDGEQEEYSEIDERLESLEYFYKQTEIIRLGRKTIPKKCMVKHSKRIMEQLFYAMDETCLENYLKYLGQPMPKNRTVVNMARQISNIIKSHPEYLCVLLEEEEIKEYLHYYHGNGRMELPDKDFIMVCALWGLMEIEAGNDKLIISFPMDIDPIVEWMEREAGAEQYTQIHSTWNHIRSLLACYGFVDVDSLYDAYVGAFGDMDLMEFRRYVYLMGNFCGRITTGMIPGGTAWAALDDKMAIMAVIGQERYAADLQYAKFSKKQILNMEAGFGKLYPQWNKVLELLCRMERDEQEAIEMMNLLYETVICGAGMDDIMEMIQKVLPKETEGGNLLRLRRALENCWCEMGISVLKGHSRREIAKAKNISALEVAAGYEEDENLNLS